MAIKLCPEYPDSWKRRGQARSALPDSADEALEVILFHHSLFWVAGTTGHVTLRFPLSQAGLKELANSVHSSLDPIACCVRRTSSGRATW